MKVNHAGTGQRITGRSLTFQLLAIVVFPLIGLLLIITFGSSRLHENAMRELVGDRDQRAVRMAATAIDAQIQRRINEIQALAGQIPVGPGEAWPAQVLIDGSAYLHDDFDAGLALLANDGRVAASRGDEAIWQTQSASEGLRMLRRDPGLAVYVSAPVVGSGKQPFMIVMAPGRDRQSVVAGAFYTGLLAEHVFANVFPVGQQASVVMFTRDMDILFQLGFSSPQDDLARHAGVTEAIAGRSGTAYTSEHESEHVVAYGPVYPYEWALLIEEPWEQVASPLLQNTHMAPLVMVPVTLLALMAIFFGIRQIVQPLQTLAKQSSRLGWGEYGAIEKPVGGVSEIQLLQHELINMAAKLRAAQQSLHSYIGAITNGQEEERRRLARELHDDTIQSLIALKQRVQLIEMDCEDHPVGQSLNELEQVAEQTIENLRRMVSALRPIFLEDLGLVAAIRMLANDTSRKLGIPVEFTLTGQQIRLDDPVELALYRIVQEALHNIARHSRASQASILLSFENRITRIEVEDNGIGFTVPGSPSEFAPGGHFGLLGIFERVDLFGGQISVNSTPGNGTRLIIIVHNPQE